MFGIAICDDEREAREYIRMILRSFTGLPPFNIDMFDSGEALIEALQAGRSYDLYILDIMLKTINGVRAGQLIRERYSDNGPQLLFISSQQRYAMELFDLHPLNFLLKPLNAEKVHECIKQAICLSHASALYFSYQFKKSIFREAFHNIRYFESINKILVIHSVKGRRHASMRLSEVLQAHPSLPANFFQIHQSYILNLEYVWKLEYSKAILDNGDTLPISYAYRKEIRSHMMQNLSICRG